MKQADFFPFPVMMEVSESLGLIKSENLGPKVNSATYYLCEFWMSILTSVKMFSEKWGTTWINCCEDEMYLHVCILRAKGSCHFCRVLFKKDTRRTYEMFISLCNNYSVVLFPKSKELHILLLVRTCNITNQIWLSENVLRKLKKKLG